MHDQSVTNERIPRARNFREVTRGFLQCREALVTFVALLCLWAAAGAWGARHAWVPVIMLGGFCLWYVIEIPIHRYILHWKPGNERMKKLMRRLHHAHHEQPTNPALLFLPEWVSLPSIAIILGVAAGFGVLAEGLWFLAGFWLSLTVYEWMHYAVHSRWRPAWGPLRRTFDDHLRHHFRNEGYWFGVSNRYMDRFWGTSPDPDSVEKSASVRDIAGDAGQNNAR